MSDDRHIAVFDSGVGGLTVLSHLAREFPFENFVYLGDTARLPYGDKSPATILKYVSQNIRFLKNLNLKAVVVACNSASTVVLHEKQFEDLPLLNVIDPGARLAFEKSQNKKIGVIGTQATIQQSAYYKKLKQMDANTEVTQIACPLLVPLVEQGWLEDPITNLIIYRYLQPLLQQEVDTLILGCTHYPLLEIGIRRVMGNNVILIHSGEALAKDLQSLFAAKNLALRSSSNPRTIRVLATDLSPQFTKLTSYILRDSHFFGPELIDLKESLT